MEYKKDCYAFIKEGECFALKEQNCKNCSFYKASKKPEATRAEITRDICEYTKKYNSKN